MAFGLTLDGFVAKSLPEIRAALNEAMWSAFGRTLDLSDGSFEGQLVGIVAAELASHWELSEAIYSSLDANKARGEALRARCALTGTIARAARAGTVALTLTGAAGTTIPAGSAARVPSGPRFATNATALLVALVAWAPGTAYAVGDRRSNGGNSYVCRTAGTSAGSGGPTTAGADITDGTAHWRYLGAGVAAIDAAATASEVGPLVANATTITEIVTPVGGWNGVINLADADPGALAERDEDLQIRRVIELAQPGTGPLDAIRAAVLAVPSVLGCRMFQNITSIVDADGMPPHSVEAMVTGGDDQAIRDTLLANVAAGIGTHGNVTGTSKDSQGTDHVVKFSRPDAVAIYVVMSIIKDPETYPADGDAQVKAAIVAWGAAQAEGKNAVASGISAQAFSVPGVLDVTACLIGTAPSPSASTTIAIGLRQRAAYDTSRISVTSSSGTP